MIPLIKDGTLREHNTLGRWIVEAPPLVTIPGITPYEAFFGVKPDVSNLRIFGSLAYVHVQKDKRGPFGSHFEKCIFLGYPDGRARRFRV